MNSEAYRKTTHAMGSVSWATLRAVKPTSGDASRLWGLGGMLILDLLLLMRRVEKRVYDSHRLRYELLSLRLILRIGKFRAIEK